MVHFNFHYSSTANMKPRSSFEREFLVAGSMLDRRVKINHSLKTFILMYRHAWLAKHPEAPCLSWDRGGGLPTGSQTYFSLSLANGNWTLLQNKKELRIPLLEAEGIALGVPWILNA